MKQIIFVTAFILCSSTAIAGEFTYQYSANATGLYGYSRYGHGLNATDKHSHTPVMAEGSLLLSYDLDQEQVISLGFDGQISGGREVEDYNHGDWGENVYGSYKFAYGEFSVGQIYNAAYQLAVGAPSVGVFKVNNSPIVDFIANPNWRRNSKVTAYHTLNSTYLNTDADSLKLSYTSADFYNTRLAFSYAPGSYSRAGLINKDSRYDNRSSYAVGLYNNTDALGLEIESSLGYAYNRKNNQEFSAGLSLYRKGWTLGGSFRKSFVGSHDYPLNAENSEYMPLGFDGFRKSYAYNVGLSYEIGPLKSGVSYFASYSDKNESKDKIITWANRYAINKFAGIYLATAYAQYTNGETAKKHYRGYALICGAELTF